MKRLLAALLAAPLLAMAQGYPSKPVRVIVPAPAGSSLDVIVRALGDKLKVAVWAASLTSILGIAAPDKRADVNRRSSAFSV